MNLQIRDPRALELAEQLARKRNITPEEAVTEALETQVRADKEAFLAGIKAVAAEAKAMAKPGGRDMTKEEIDEMWGH